MEKIILKRKEAIILFFLFILIILIILAVAVHTSKIEIKIENLKINTEKLKGQKINDDKKIYLYIVIFEKIKIFKRKLDIENIKLRNKNLRIDYKPLLQNIKLHVKEIDLKVEIGTQDAAVTAVLVGIVTSLIGIILRKPKYQITPMYTNKNFLKVELDGILSVHLMQYIYRIISNKIKEFWKNSYTKMGIFQNRKMEV